MCVCVSQWDTAWSTVVFFSQSLSTLNDSFIAMVYRYGVLLDVFPLHHTLPLYAHMHYSVSAAYCCTVGYNWLSDEFFAQHAC